MIICEDSDYKEAAEFYASKLGIEHILLAVILHPELHVSGYCEHYTDSTLPYCIVGIESDEAECDPLEVLAHEMVHVKQYVTGELVNHASSGCYWHGKFYEEPELGSEEYYFSPWELEAYGKQIGLYQLYCRSLEE